jgi:hypothetical protein
VINSTSASAFMDKLDSNQASSLSKGSQLNLQPNLQFKSSKSSKRSRKSSKRAKRSSKKFINASKVTKKPAKKSKPNKKDSKIIKKLQQNQQMLQLELKDLFKERQMQQQMNMKMIETLRRQQDVMIEQVVSYEAQYKDYQNISKHMNSIIGMLSNRIQNEVERLRVDE